MTRITLPVAHGATQQGDYVINYVIKYGYRGHGEPEGPARRDVRADGRAKDASLIERYYHPDFLLHTNGGAQDYEQIRRRPSPGVRHGDQLRRRYDEQAWVVTDDRVADRVWITTERPTRSRRRSKSCSSRPVSTASCTGSGS